MVSDDGWAKCLVRAIFGLVSSDDGWRHFLITGQYPHINSNVRNVNVQYQISDFLEIVSIDIFGHGAMNIILPKNVVNLRMSRASSGPLYLLAILFKHYTRWRYYSSTLALLRRITYIMTAMQQPRS